MSTRVGDIYVDMSLRFQNLTAGIRQVTSQVASMGTQLSRNFGSNITNSANNATASIDTMGGSLDRVSRIVKGILISQAFYAGIHAIKGATEELFSFNNQLEVAQVSFTLLMDSADDAKNFISAMEDFAATTPFGMQDTVAAAQRLMAMGFAAENVVPTLRTLTDAASLMGATPEVIGRITMALGQMQTEGYVSGRQMRSLGMAGIPALQILQEELGVTKEELKNIGKLKIPGDMGAEAILRGMNKRYANASALIARTNTGLIATIKDDFLLIGKDVLEGPFARLHVRIEKIADAMERIRKTFRTGGMKGLFENLVPERMRTTVLALATGIGFLMRSIKDLWNAFGPLRSAMGEFFTRFMTIFIPVIALFVDSIASLIAYVSQASPFVKALGGALMYLMIASTIGLMVRGLAASLALLQVASIAAAAVHYLAAAFRLLALAMIANPVGAVIGTIVAVLAILAMQSDTVSNALDALMTRIAALFGVDFGSMLAVGTKGSEADIAAFNDGLGSINDSMGDLGDETDDTNAKAKALKDNLMSFDQVHTLDKDPAGGKDKAGPRDWKLPAGNYKVPVPKLDNPIAALGLDKLKIPTPPWIAALLAALAALKIAWDKWRKPKPPLPPPPDEPKPKGKKSPKTVKEPKPEPVTKPKPSPVLDPEPAVKPPKPVREPYGPPKPEPYGPPKPAPGLSDDLQRKLDDIFKKQPEPVTAPNTEPYGPPKPKRARAPKKVFNPDLTSDVPLGQQKRVWEEDLKDVARQKRRDAAQRKKAAEPQPVKEPVKGMPDEEFQEFLRKIGAMGTAIVGLNLAIGSFQSNLSTAYATVSAFGNSLATTVSSGITSVSNGLAIAGAYVTAWAIAYGLTLQGWKVAASTAFTETYAVASAKTSEWATGASSTMSTFFKSAETFWTEHKTAVLVTAGVIAVGVVTALTVGLAPAAAVVVTAGVGIAESIGIWAVGFGASAGVAALAVSSKFSGVAGVISGYLSKVPGVVQNVLASAGGLLNKFAIGAGGYLSKLGPAIGSGGGGASRAIPVFSFAKGGILTKESLIRVAENGNEAVVPLSGGGMKPFAQAIAAELGGAPGANGSSGSSGGAILQVGILIGDERSYRELERRLKTVRLGEQARGVV